ncbi:MAG: glycosyltransferase family 39 protein, partial [Candidatus Omnitrophica bacterium]|nr:glycosyltransferase family 39 protein [Candidatus Omnitrophota bacterium]
MNPKIKNIVSGIVIFLCGCLLYSNGLNVHGFEFRDDEVFYKKSTQEMVASSDVLSPKYFGDDRFQKPILYYWFILAAYKIFGVSWFAARITSTLFAAGALVLTWLIARTLFNKPVGYLSVLILMTMPLFFRHAKNAVPDMALNFFVVLAMYFFVRFLNEQHARKYAIGFFLACATGFMVKGFAALLFPYLTVLLYAVWKKEWSVVRDMRFLSGTFIFLAVVLPWFLYMTAT